MHYPRSFEKLIRHFSQLPSIGPKMAERLVLHLFRQDADTVLSFSESIKSIAELKQCSRCFHVCEKDLCDICRDKRRDMTVICVVEDPIDVISIERVRIYNGLYHILGGLLEVGRLGKNAPELTIPQLIARIKKEKIREIIIATNPTSEGDMTALYLKRILIPLKVRVTRLARGLSTGGDIEYADEETLSASLTNRKSVT